MRLIAAVTALLLAFAGCLEADAEAPETEPGAPGGELGTELTAPVWGGLDSPIRPGASLGGYCTFNFLYYDAVTGDAYIGTAGHCTDEIGERLTLPGVGEIATVVFDSDLVEAFPNVNPAVDFTLAKLDPEHVAHANPQMLGWNGPTGIVHPDDLALGDMVNLHGYGVVLGQNDVTRDRQGVLTAWNDEMYNVDMPAVNGDSGSPLMHDETNMALGVISHYGIGAVPPSTDEGPLMHWVMIQIANAGFPDVVLATV